MNFWIIFLCLLIGAVIGFEFGKYMITKRVQVYLDDAIQSLKATAENLQKQKEREKIPEKPHANPLVTLGIVGFNPKYYKVPDGKEIPEGFERKKELDDISNLIATMTYTGALDSEIGRAVRYSMVVVETEKERLDWKRAREDEGIDILQNKYGREMRRYGEGN